ncbi:hypothetical protein MKX01_016993 [Papaver californicum]|nr:hypothetical protein MKX01_016993 [Papaver californicum]
MEFPFGHHNRNHREQEEEEYRHQPPPPSYRNEQEDEYRYGPPPPPSYGNEHEQHHHERPPPPYERFEERPPPYEGFGEVPPPPPRQEFGYGGYTQSPGYPSVVQHVSHEHQSFEPNPSNEFHHESSGNHRRPPGHEYDGSSEGSAGMPNINNKRTVKIYSKAGPDYSLTIRDGEVVLSRSNENDEFQHWIKDEQFSTRVKDEKGMPSFALVNKATGQAIKHSIAATNPVRLIPYNPNYLDQSILWTESKDLGDGYRSIRMVNDIHLNIDAFKGDKKDGGLHDGTIVVLWQWKYGENQLWKIVPYYCKFFLLMLR